MRITTENLTTIDEFKAELLRRDAAKQDFVAPLGLAKMYNDARTIELEDKGVFTALPTFESQVIGHDGHIPTKHYRYLQSTHPDLLSVYINRQWQADGERKRMFRTLDGKARAFFSDKYRPFDNAFTLKASAPVFEQFKEKGLNIQTYNLTDDYMFLQLVLPSFSAEVIPGDVVNLGLTLRNSEVGKAQMEVRTMLWRLICENGVIGSTILSRRHVGSRIDFDSDDVELYQHDTLEAEKTAYQLRMRDVIKASITDEIFEAKIEDLREANGEVFSKKKTRPIIEEVSKKFSFSEEEMDGIFSNIASESNYSKYGLMNAVTALSHDEDNPEKQFSYEIAGQKIIEIESDEWKSIVA